MIETHAGTVVAFLPMVAFRSWVAAARELLEADAGSLWGISLASVPWLGIEGDRVLATERPGVAGFEPDGPGIWSGPRPPELAAVNTALDWAGRRWATCGLPLRPESAVRLLVHEAWHAIQPELLPDLQSAEMEPGGDVFDTIEGRVWLRLELAALGAALTSKAPHQTRAAAAALAFRDHRHHLARAEERQRERFLDIAEGLAEYTAWRLTRATPFELAEELAAPPPTSWTRAFCYRTGPAYGYLLDDLAPGWRSQVHTVRDLQALLAHAVEARADAAAEAAAYDTDRIRAEETAAQEPIDTIKRRFATTRRLRIRPGSAGMQVRFDPRQVWSNDEGTIYGSFTWTGNQGGRLTADGGALVTFDWTEASVPLGDASVGHGVTEGDGWTLHLPENWGICPENGSVRVEPPPPL